MVRSMSRRRPISPKTALVQDVAYEHGKDVLSLHCTETGEVGLGMLWKLESEVINTTPL